MFESDQRLIYLDELRPPGGYVLDQAVATTFSLDLLALLMAPLSMALQQCADSEQLLKDPVALLESLRRTAGRVTVFCQHGRTSVPRQHSLLYSNLDRVVVGVQAPNSKGVFHPKTWLLRLAPLDEEDPVLYRFLCLSRNLTFDKSWDTVVSLEGPVKRSSRGLKANKDLVAFYEALPDMAVTPVEEDRLESIRRMTDELRRVDFQAPDHFYSEDTSFHPSGLGGGRDERLDLSGFDRLLIVSPFVTDDGVRDLLETRRQKGVLISRHESLDGLSDKTIAALRDNAEIYCLLDAAEPVDDDGGAEAPAENRVGTDGQLHGLHAKLYVGDKGAWSQVLTGSANSTSAGLKGVNVELMVGLWGHRRHINVERFLGDEDDKHAFRRMLVPYMRQADSGDSLKKRLEDFLEAARRALASVQLQASVRPRGEGVFELAIEAGREFADPMSGIAGRCYPITLSPEAGRDLGDLATGGELAFGPMSMVALTGFIAFELATEIEGKKASISFVLNVPVADMPEKRDKTILHAVISNQARFVRYLLFLLAGEDDPTGLSGLIRAIGNGNSPRSLVDMGIPLLEELVRAYSRSPEKIDRIAELVTDLRATEEGRSRLPEGFDETWRVFERARELREGTG